MDNKPCPICNKTMMNFKRYPNMICHSCVELATTKNGESIKFYNENNIFSSIGNTLFISRGFVSIVNGVINPVLFAIKL